VLFRRCANVTLNGANASGMGGFHVDRSPPPLSQLTVAKVSGKDVELTLDGDSQDPHLLGCDDDPSVPPKGGQHCTGSMWWAKGSRAPDGRPGSHGLPGSADGGSVNPSMLKKVGPKRYSTTLKNAVHVGDQVVISIWRGFTYVVANSSRVTTQDVAVHAGGYMAIQEMDGEGDHMYRNVQLVPRNGELSVLPSLLTSALTSVLSLLSSLLSSLLTSLLRRPAALLERGRLPLLRHGPRAALRQRT